MTPEEGKRYLNLLKADKSAWVDNHCEIPFQNIMINAQGDLYSCWCEAWLPKPIGNIMDVKDWEEFENLFTNNPVRNSILDRSHRYCRGNICTNLQQKFDGDNPKEFVDINRLQKQNLYILRISMDSSCNLNCISCRNNVIINHHSSFVNDLQEKLDRIDKIFFNPRRVNSVFIDGTGEFLASKTLFSWMLDKASTGIEFWLQTNGTLLSNHRDKMATILDATSLINVSIDGSCKEVFETTRRGGNWEKLIEGLEMLNQMKANRSFRIRYNYTISSLNYHDVGNFIKFCQLMKPDLVFYSKIERWSHFTDEQWTEYNVFSQTHPEYSKLVPILENIEWPKNSSRNFNYKI